jgi:hypothetical protein
MYGELNCNFSSAAPSKWATDNLSSLTALLTALSDLDTLCETIGGAYEESLMKDSFERWEEKS